MDIIKNYVEAEQAILDHVGIKKDWVVYPFSFSLGVPWSTNGEQVKYADSLEQFNSDGDYYLDDIYTQRFYKKHVWRGEKYTLIFCHPHVDGMIWWGIFENSFEQEW